ncbi:MAG: GNAT family N-acetyltransferase [Pseudomonadota bacterium]
MIRPSGIPTLSTKHLTLRAARVEDFDAYADFLGSDAAAMVDGPMTRREAWRRFIGLPGHWALRGYGWWILDDGAGPVGTCGIHFPPTHPEPELGWMLFPAAQGKGFATEAAHAARNWWYGRGETRLASNIHFDNAPSIAVARRLGCTTDGTPLAHYPVGSAWIHPGPDEAAA